MFDLQAPLALLIRSSSNRAINKWLKENPLALGAICLVLGGALAASGVFTLKHGTTSDKFGNEVSGGKALFLAIVRLVAGVVLCGFGIYKMIAG